MLCLATLMVSLDITILNVALPTISESLHATTAELQWIVDFHYWGSVFWINVPVVAIAVAAGVLLLREARNPAARRASPRCTRPTGRPCRPATG